MCPGDYFYQHVLDLNDLEIVSGYNSAPPCENLQAHIPCSKPYNSTIRGQVAKIIWLAAAFSEPVATQIRSRMCRWTYLLRICRTLVIAWYHCRLSMRQAGEPCGPDNLPYFRPGVTVNRAQLSKMASLAFGFEDPVSGQTFQDVVPQNHFYPYIENLAGRSIINGYPCGGLGEPCIPPGNRPYFRFGNSITRGQVAKIVISPEHSQRPRLHWHRPTRNLYSTPTSIPTDTPTPSGTSSS